MSLKVTLDIITVETSEVRTKNRQVLVFVIDGLSGPEAVPFITFSNRPGCPLQREIDRRSESVFLDEG